MSITVIPLGQQVYLDFTTSSPASGFVESASTTPKFWVFDNGSDSPLIAASGARQRTGFPGQYNLFFAASSGNGFNVGHFYNVMLSGNVEGIQGQTTLASFYVTANSLDSLPSMTGIWSYAPRTTTIESGDYAYYADVKFTKNGVSLRDEYTVDWFKNTQPVGSANITSPTIQVFKRTDGSSLIAQHSMNYVSSNLGTLKYDETVNLAGSGDAYIVQVSAGIDGSTRTWNKLISRDS